MDSLPIDAILPEIKAVLAGNRRAVLAAAPGAGKTTRVPLALLDVPWLNGRRIVILEPRRLAARAAAARMAETLGETVGETVGYAVRLERRVSPRTRIEVVTEGILTRRLQSDPELKDTGALIFDEFHERSLDGDIGLALALDVQRALREDLRILVMSATLDETRLSTYLGNAPVVAEPGRLFPVETRYGDRPERAEIARATARNIVREIANTKSGMLAFLPGEAEIRRCAAALSTASLPGNVRVMPLHGTMALVDQVTAIRPTAPGLRKIVLATTIAETSLTIEGVDTVVDCGYKRTPQFDPASGMTSLATVRVSQASADQRRGRAGRLGPGRCLRLWPEEETRALKPYDSPEILQADLASLALELAAWGIADPSALSWLDPPPRAAFAQAHDLLVSLDALDQQGRITQAGKEMAALPLHPRLAHMVVVGKALGSGARAADLAAILSDRDILSREAGADIALRLSALGRGNDRIRAAARQLRSIARIEDGSEVSIGLLVALAWPDRIAQARGSQGRFRLSGGGGAILPAHDPLASEKWLAVATTDGGSGDQRIFLAAKLALSEIEAHFASHIDTRDTIAWDHRAQAVTIVRQRKLGALTLSETPLTDADAELIADAMINGIRAMGIDVLPWSEPARNLLARLRFVKRTFPEEPWPEVSEASLAATLDRWLGPYLAGMTRRSHLDRLDMLAILRSLVRQASVRRLDRLAPSHVAIPSGASIAIDYDTGGDPILRARLQEMFGLLDTPQIAEGRVRLKVELLSPARRPLALTQDLRSFWTNAYPQVRAEMRGRYPKHPWPENPLVALPVKPGKLR